MRSRKHQNVTQGRGSSNEFINVALYSLFVTLV